MAFYCSYKQNGRQLNTRFPCSSTRNVAELNAFMRRHSFELYSASFNYGGSLGSVSRALKSSSLSEKEESQDKTMIIILSDALLLVEF